MISFITYLLLLFVVNATHGDICDLYDGVYKFTHGAWSVTVLRDGTLRLREGFFTVPLLLAQAANGHKPLTASLNPVVLQSDRHVVLIDGGYGSSGAPFAGELLQRMNRVGIAPEMVTTVLCTHAHNDHVLGLLKENGQPTFPNANLHIGRVEHQFWTRELGEIMKLVPHVNVDLLNRTCANYRRILRAYRTRFHLIDDNDQPIPDIHAVYTPGHSPGHLSYRITSGGRNLLVSGDAFMTRTSTIQHPHWNIFSEAFREQATRTRYELFEYLSKNQQLVLTFHADFPGLGYVVRYGTGFDWLPLE